MSATTYLNRFLEAKLAAGRVESTLRFYRDTLGQFIKFIDDWPPGPDDIRSYLIYKRQTCNETSISTAYTAIRSFLNWCEREQLLDDNPINRIDKPRKAKRLPKVVTVDTMRKFLEVIEEHAQLGDKLAIRDYAIFRLMYDTGCRCAELARLRLDDLDLYRQETVVRQGKEKKDRVVFFGRKSTAALRSWLNIHPGGEWLFPSRIRTELRPLTRRGVYHALQKWSRMAGLSSMTVHQIRHSYATHALRRGIDLQHISNQLGHSDISTTAIYLALDDEDRRRAHQELAPGDAI